MKRSARFEPAVEEKRADQRLDDVADDIVALAGAVLAGLLAEPDERRNADLAADLGASFAVDQRVVALRQIAFGLVRITLVERARRSPCRARGRRGIPAARSCRAPTLEWVSASSNSARSFGSWPSLSRTKVGDVACHSASPA